MNDQPPSLFTLYGAAMIGREGLPELPSLALRKDDTFYETWDWTDVRLKAERRAADRLTVQDRAIDVLRSEAPMALFFDDGSGELADIVSISSSAAADAGELITVSLYHCKASSEAAPGARVADYYEVAGQAIKSTRRLIFSEIRDHLRRRASAEGGRGFEIGDMDLVDDLLSGSIQRLYTYEIAIVQPGLSAKGRASSLFDGSDPERGR